MSLPSAENTATASLPGANSRAARSGRGSAGRIGSEPMTRMACASPSATREQVQVSLCVPMRNCPSRGAPVEGSVAATRAISAASGSSAAKLRSASAAGVAAPSNAAPLALAQATRASAGAHSTAGTALIA